MENAIEVKPSQLLRQTIKCTVSNQPQMIWGAPGIGKSGIIAQAAKMLGMQLIDIRLTTRAPSDLAFPFPNTKDRIVEWFIAEIVKRVENGPTIIFLDELSSALPAVQVQAYQLIYDRVIGDYKLPDDCRVMAAGNRIGDYSVAYKQSRALESRMTHVTLVPDLDEFCIWSLRNGIAHEVISFVRFSPDQLFNLDPDVDGAFPCPRAWEAVSKLIQPKDSKVNIAMFPGLQSLIDADPELWAEIDGKTSQTTADAVCGTVGLAAGSSFNGFLKVYEDLPKIDHILLDPKAARIPKDQGARIALMTGLAAHAKKHTIDAITQYLARMPAEMEVTCMKLASEVNPEIMDTNAFTSWAVKDNQRAQAAAA